ncbi:MAG: tRNA pseudouridine(55) synthase TruB, partial [Coleofasciculus sp. C2-GNP5-27]
GGTLASLIRTQSSGFRLDNSLTLDELAAQVQAESFTPIPPEAALNHLAKVTLSPDDARRWCQGQRIKGEDKGQTIEGDDHGINKQNMTPDTSTDSVDNIRRVYHEYGTFLGITQVIESDGEVWFAPKMVLAN